MKAFVFLSVIFLLVFGLLFWFFCHENKKEQEKDSIGTIIFGTSLFAFLITGVFAFFLFLIMGSANVVDRLFSLHMDTNQLVMIGISFLIYLFAIDNLLEKVFEILLGKNMYAILSLLLTRMAAFYFIGLLLDLDQPVNMAVSIGVSLILVVADLLFSSKDES